MEAYQTNPELPPTVAHDSPRRIPLCVDLDGTLLKTDLLWEGVLSLIKHNPRALLAAPFWLLSGRVHLKRRLAESGAFEPQWLPYRAEVLELIRTERAQGRPILLVSAADRTLAEKVAAHLDCFDEVIANDGRINLKGEAKRELLEARFGRKGFDYVGDHAADLPVWQAARVGFIVSRNQRLIRRAQAVTSLTMIPDDAAGLFRKWSKAMRLHQWSKNILVFVPIVTSHKITQPAILLEGAVAFLAFSLVSSSVYLFNDLADLAADRGHKRKRTRMFASGALKLSHGVFLAAALLLAGLGLGLAGGRTFVAILAIYYATSCAYSAYFKQIVVLDVMVLAGFYTLRIFSGGAATGIGVSVWLLAFSMFFFFSLALVKRYSELLSHVEGNARASGRGYFASDLPALATFGIASGFISVLVLVLYVMSPEVTLLYENPHVLLFLCPLLLYWLGRVWVLTTRSLMDEDPVVFALTDRASYALGLFAVLVVFLGT